MESFGKSHAHEVGDNSKCATHGKVGILFFNQFALGVEIGWDDETFFLFFFILPH